MKNGRYEERMLCLVDVMNGYIMKSGRYEHDCSYNIYHPDSAWIMAISSPDIWISIEYTLSILLPLQCHQISIDSRTNFSHLKARQN